MMLQYKNVTLEACTHRKNGYARTWFIIKGETEHSLEISKSKLRAVLGTIVTHIIQAPVSVVGVVIGRKGEGPVCLTLFVLRIHIVDRCEH